MKTDDFVTMLATGALPIPAGTARRRHALALACGSLGALVLMLAFLGVRADLAQVVHLPMFWIKLAFPLCLAAAALVAASRLSRPGARLRHLPVALLAPLLVIELMAAGALVDSAPNARLALLLGQTWTMCPLLIAALSVPAFIANFWAISGLAPTRPALAGAAAGLLAGAVATAVYALHCPELAAPFLATWYVLGMLIPTLAGALLGAYRLRW